ncbi:MAG TPA: VOC family protein [Gemmatimonadales bacterium]|nr:VOC family protein [Gemmatimonadales bacterium]
MRTPTTPGHIGLSVRDLSRSIPFYTTTFALDLVHRGEAHGTRFAFLGAGGDVTLTLWEQPAGAPGLHHLAFRTDSIAELHQAETRLKGLGASLVYDGVVPHAEGSSSGGLFFTDPDGIRLELCVAHGVGGTAPVSGAPSCGFF